MNNQKRVIHETACRTGLSVKVISKIISSQLGLLRRAIVSKAPVSVYIRNVGTFISPDVNYHLIGLQHCTRAQNKIKNANKIEDEDPLEFN
ncbi:MAG TPA: hypothetical protein ENI20_03270 [Bacteroides sp.]|nr:hypothetical protein [Bacteroides sp.]